MSQFILFTKNKCDDEHFLKINEEKCFLSMADKMFHTHENIYTIENFEDICVNAQGIQQKDFMCTQLYNLLSLLKDEEIYCWYASDYTDLDNFNNFEALIQNIIKNLNEGSGEMYFHYKKQY